MKTTHRLLVAFSLFLVAAAELSAQAGAEAVQPLPVAGQPRTLEARHLGVEVPRIDGELNDAAWSAAPVASGFVQMEPNPGAPASHETEVRVLYDDRYLYVAARMYDPEPELIGTQLSRRDGSGGGNSDWVHVLIDGYHDRRTAFRFSLNPSGVQADVLHFDDTEEDENWDAVWEGAARIDSEGWAAEFRIPLSQLRYSESASERSWGINFARRIGRSGEESAWSPILPSVRGLVSQSGVLQGLAELKSPRRLELIPYSVARTTRTPTEPGNPLHDPATASLELGGDLRYGVTSNLTLSATFNPDFGQVEADPSEVNLSAFESFFSERRPFFLEGGNIFAFGIGVDDNSGETLFYSRRIGRSPQRSIDTDDGWEMRPEATRILGAAKLSGKTSGGWTVGALNALTGAEYSRVAEPGRPERRELIEPLTNYTVATVARDFDQGGSTIGGMATATHRRVGSDQEVAFLREAAYSFALRGRHLFADRTWEANATIGGSHIRGDEEAITRVQEAAGHYFQRPDAEHLDFDPTRTTLTGAIADASVFKVAGSKFRGGAGAHLRTPGLELNDLGFQSEADQAITYLSAAYRQYDPQWIFRRWSVNLNPSAAWTTDGERTWTQFGHSVDFEFHNLWNGGWWVGKRFAALNVGALRGGPAIRAPGGVRYSLWLNSDQRRPVTVNASASGGREDDSGGWDHGVDLGLTARPSSSLRVTLTPGLRRRYNPWQYVSQHEVSGATTRYLFGTLDQTTVRLTARVDYTLSTALSLQFYAQPFVSSARYENFMRVEDPRAARFEERFHHYAPAELSRREDGRFEVRDPSSGAIEYDFEDPGFSFRQLRSNAVLRWEFRPGSALFFVWSQGRTGEEEYAEFDFTRDLDHLRGAPASNVFLIKASYWFNP